MSKGWQPKAPEYGYEDIPIDKKTFDTLWDLGYIESFTCVMTVKGAKAMNKQFIEMLRDAKAKPPRKRKK